LRSRQFAIVSRQIRPPRSLVKVIALLRLIDRYIAAKILSPFGAVLLIGLSILLVERVVSVLNKTFGKGDVLFTVLEMLAYLAPYNLGFAIPIALYLAVLLGFGKISREHGIDAMQANGVSLIRMMAPAMVFAFLLMLVSLVVVGWLQPHGRYAYRSLVYQLENIAVYALLDEGVFLHADGRTIIIDKIDRGNSTFEHIFVYEDKTNATDPSSGETLASTAQSGRLIEDTGKAAAVLRLANGGFLRIDPGQKSAADSAAPPHQWGGFAESELPLGSESALAFRSRGYDHRELTLPELFRYLNNPPPNTTVDKMRAELHSRLLRLFMLPVLPILAVPFAIGSRRSLPSVRYAVAFVLLIAFHQIVDQGAFLTSEYGISPWLTQWLPYGLITLFAVWRFWRVGMTVTKPWGFWQYLDISGLLRRKPA
jgi:lipopolysaccharide export system permease protein